MRRFPGVDDGAIMGERRVWIRFGDVGRSVCQEFDFSWRKQVLREPKTQQAPRKRSHFTDGEQSLKGSGNVGNEKGKKEIKACEESIWGGANWRRVRLVVKERGYSDRNYDT